MKRPDIDSWYVCPFLVIFIILMTVISSLLIYIERQHKISELAETQLKEKQAVHMELSLLTTRLTPLVSDVSYLHDIYETRLSDPVNYEQIAQDWVVFSNKRQIYDQIRFISLNGDEKICIDLQENGAVRLPPKDLQNDKDRRYFYEAANQAEGTLLISQLDLNIENSQIETPYKPMIRLSMPLHDKNDQYFGVLVVNYLANDFLNLFKQYEEIADGHIMLLNESGYFLSSPDKNLEWGFVLPGNQENRFNYFYPIAWSEIQQGENQVITPKGLFTAQPIDLQQLFRPDEKSNILPQTILSKNQWYIISWIPKIEENGFLYVDDYSYLFSRVYQQVLFPVLILLALILSAIGTYLLHYYKHINYHAEYDPLTHAYNRHGGTLRLRELYDKAKNNAPGFSLCFMDVNGLKEINDTLGHAYGDEMIKTAIYTIQTEIRHQDFIVRIGGDEFILIFPYVNTEQAESIWLRIRSHLDLINDTENRPYLLSLSHGIVNSHVDTMPSLDSFISLADQRMYAEKQIIKKNFTSIRTNPEAASKQ